MKKQLAVSAITMMLMASSSQIVFAQDGSELQMSSSERAALVEDDSAPLMEPELQAASAEFGGSIMKSSAPIPPGHFGLIARYADRFLSANNGTGGNRTIYSQKLMDGIDDPALADEIADFYLLDIRKPADYAAGHIAGAVNVQFGKVADPATLAALPTDKPILVICYTGHTASVANAVLGVLGYDAWTLRFGMVSWKAANSVGVWTPNQTQMISGGNYPMVQGNTP
jgi:rhodanese-related sulfurtransferase